MLLRIPPRWFARRARPARWLPLRERLAIRPRVVAAGLTLALTIAAAPAQAVAPPAPGSPTPPIEVASPSAVLMEVSSGEILFAKNPDERRHPASVTKVMTLLLAIEAIEQGRAAWDDVVTASQAAQDLGGTTIFLHAGEKVSLRDLLRGIAIASGNDAALAVAEHLDGTEAAFVERMNRRAAELGMTNTRFANPHGFDHPEHYTTARDLAILSREAVRHPELLKLTGVFLDKLIHRDARRQPETELVNRNRLVRFYTGADGLKTGWTREAGYTIAATAKRGAVRLVATVMGAPTPDARMADARRLLDHGFSRFMSVEVAADGEPVGGPIPVVRGRADAVTAVVSGGLSVAVPRGAGKEVAEAVELEPFVAAPVEKGQRLGWLIARRGGQEVGRAPLVAASAVPRAGLLETWWKTLRRALAP